MYDVKSGGAFSLARAPLRDQGRAGQSAHLLAIVAKRGQDCAVGPVPQFARSKVAPGLAAAALLCTLVSMASPVLAAGACALTATPLKFGLYDELSPVVVRAVANVTYTCTAGLPRGVRIVLVGSLGPLDLRTMKGPNRGRLRYGLFLDPAGMIPWGDGTEGTQPYVDPSPVPGKSTTVNIFGYVMAHQKLPSQGLYKDSVQAIAEY